MAQKKIVKKAKKATAIILSLVTFSYCVIRNINKIKNSNKPNRIVAVAPDRPKKSNAPFIREVLKN